MRAAFDKTAKNPAFLNDAKKRNMLIGTAPGAEIQRVVAAIISTPDDVVAKTRKMLGYK